MRCISSEEGKVNSEELMCAFGTDINRVARQHTELIHYFFLFIT